MGEELGIDLTTKDGDAIRTMSHGGNINTCPPPTLLSGVGINTSEGSKLRPDTVVNVRPGDYTLTERVESSPPGLLPLSHDQYKMMPSKRRPGRPPGSTKKNKAFLMSADAKRMERAGDEFSLRRFFEAGGRDYNEYLEWLKRRKNRSESLGQNGGMQLPSQMLPNGVVLPHFAIPNFLHAQARELGMMPPQNFPGHFPPAMYRTLLTPPASSLANQQMRLANEMHSVRTMASTISATKGFSENLTGNSQDTCALDLSRKRPSLDSEYQSKRLHHSREETGSNELSNSQVERIVNTVSQENCGNINTWGVDQVVNFISTVPDCAEYASFFREQRIDGATLPHLSERHLLDVVNMKLGPAIKLHRLIAKLASGT